MHSVNIYVRMIGKGALYHGAPFRVTVKITDIKTAYGKVRYFVEPLHGDGGAWVDETSLTQVGMELPKPEVF